MNVQSSAEIPALHSALCSTSHNYRQKNNAEAVTSYIHTSCKYLPSGEKIMKIGQVHPAHVKKRRNYGS